MFWALIPSQPLLALWPRASGSSSLGLGFLVCVREGAVWVCSCLSPIETHPHSSLPAGGCLTPSVGRTGARGFAIRQTRVCAAFVSFWKLLPLHRPRP